MIINMNTAIYSKGILINKKSKILKAYFVDSFPLGFNLILPFNFIKILNRYNYSRALDS